VGQKSADAQRTLEAAGFHVTINKFAGGFFDTVRVQDPAAGTMVTAGAMVTLTVA
jgi:beta-lactam-binding protein with PASTA domain